MTVTDNCGASETASVIITQPVSLSASANTAVNILCNGASSGSASSNILGGTSPYTYSWSPSGGSGQNATNLSAGIYTLVITDNNGCTATAFTTITQPSSIGVSASASSNISCNGANTGSATSTATGGPSPYTYSWSPAGGTGANASNLSAGTYTITVTDNNGCTGTATTNINGISVKPEITGFDFICKEATTTLAALDTGTAGALKYLWSTGATSSTITVSSSGTYSVVIQNGNCEDSTSVNVALDNPGIFACCDTIIQLGNSTHLDASGASSYKWISSPASIINCDSCADLLVSPTLTTSYTVTGIDSLGCSIEKVIVVTVEIPCINLVVPNVFTPNYAGPNGVNNVFYIKTKTIDSWSIFIYDRWGKEMYKSSNPLQYWDGTSESKGQAPDGVYYYIIKATCQGTAYKKDGFVQLIR